MSVLRDSLKSYIFISVKVRLNNAGGKFYRTRKGVPEPTKKVIIGPFVNSDKRFTAEYRILVKSEPFLLTYADL